MDDCLKILKDHKFKITPKRKAVIELFLTSRKCLKPYDVYKAVRKRLDSLGLPTIYRILDEFCRIGIIKRLQSDDGQLVYAFCSSQKKHSHYFVCLNCNKVQEVSVCNINGISRYIEKNLGAKVEYHQLQLEGICSECK
jgi:Fe2+ or Zn2+ uptake regulation protein